MASQKRSSAGTPDQPHRLPLRSKLDPRLDILLGLGKKAVFGLRKREHGELRRHALELHEATLRLREALEYAARPEGRLQLERAILAPIRARGFRPLTAGIRFPNQQHDLPRGLRRREPLLSVIVRTRLLNGDLKRLGFVVRSRVGEFCTAWVAWSKLASGALEKQEDILSIELARASVAHLDRAMPYTGLANVHAGGFDGTGVIVGVADRYIDFRHPAFLSPDGNGGVKTRIVSIWAQGKSGVANASSPAARGANSPVASELAGLVDGVEYTRQEIDQTLANTANPYSPVDHEPPLSPGDDDLHGTMVCGAALGHDPANGPPRDGAAPGAELVFVHLRDEMPLDAWKEQRDAAENQAQPKDLPPLAMVDSASLIDACAYSFARAQELGKPCVVNLSYGDTLGPHDGTSVLEQALDAFLAVPERVIVVSAGNEQGLGSHASGAIAPLAQGGTSDIDISVGPAAQRAEEVQIWFDKADPVQVTIEHRVQAIDPPTTVLANVVGPATLSSALAGVAEAVVQVRCPDTNASTSVTVLLLPDAGSAILAEGYYRIHIVATGPVVGNYQAWMSRSNDGSRFLHPDATQQSITTPATANKVIAVGAHSLSGPPPGIDMHSSIGKTRDGRQKPDLCAPTGVMTAAFEARPALGTDPVHGYANLTGTSAAAPIVAGAAAVVMQMQAQAGVVPDCASVLRDLVAATRMNVQGAFDAKIWGAGWLDFSVVQTGQAPAAAMAEPGIIPATPPRALERKIPLSFAWDAPGGGLEVRALGPPEDLGRLEVELRLEHLHLSAAAAARLAGTKQPLGARAVAELLDVGGAKRAEIADGRVRIQARGAFLLFPRLALEDGKALALDVYARAAPGSLRRPAVRVLEFQAGRAPRAVIH